MNTLTDTHLKALPLGIDAQELEALFAERAGLEQFPTPLVTLSESALVHNLHTMNDWCDLAGVGLAPHGKTTMSRQLWQRQLDTGSWGITVATPWQASLALAWDVPRIMLANALVQAPALHGLAPHTSRLTVWSDSLRGVEIMHDVLTAAGAQDPLSVIVEVGGEGGRTGVRSLEDGMEVARAVAASPVLALVGVGGYEGALAHDATPASLQRVRGYLESIGDLHDRLLAEGLYPASADLILTAGGSAYFDQVAEVLAPRHDPTGVDGPATRVLLRSGAYLVHDDGFYRGISPLARRSGEGGPAFRSAMHGWASVVSRPESGLALVDAGKRDFPFDEGLPEPQAVRRFGNRDVEQLDGARCTAMNDQHTFVQLAGPDDVQVGDVIRFGLSHPCTTFDKWRALLLIDDDRVEAPGAIGLVETEFG